MRRYFPLVILAVLFAASAEAQATTVAVGADTAQVPAGQIAVLQRYKADLNASDGGSRNDADTLIELARKGWDEVKNQQAAADKATDAAFMAWLRENQESLPAAVRNSFCAQFGKPNGCTF